MANETTTYQCPNCNGRLRFNGELGKLQCEFCESTFTLEEVEALFAEKQGQADAKAAGDRAAEVTGEDVPNATTAGQLAYNQALAEGKSPQQAAKAAKAAMAAASAGVGVSAAEASKSAATKVDVAPLQPDEDAVHAYLNRSDPNSFDESALRAYNCPACGAQLMVDQTTAVTSCPYCGNNAVVPGQLSDVLEPDCLIPFKLDKEAAVSALKSYYGGKRFLPDAFTENNHIEEVQGVYVPFWLYSGVGSADMTFNAENVRTWHDHDYDYVETDHYVLQRVGTVKFDKIPVDGSTKMPDAHMDAIEPYDYSELVPFSMAYLPGYLTDRYDLGADECKKRATDRACVTTESEIASTAHGYMGVSVANSRSNAAWNEASYALLPVWMLHTKWKGEDFLFAMNGQTGKLIGDLPIDKGKVRKRWWSLFLPIAIVLLAGVAFLFGA
ncbi:MAG: hypothetical protein IJH04_02755 [Eggerthellaceae bacterium]|nr:hypothetical protein [Eggerthellaceae bacterium]